MNEALETFAEFRRESVLDHLREMAITRPCKRIADFMRLVYLTNFGEPEIKKALRRAVLTSGWRIRPKDGGEWESSLTTENGHAMLWYDRTIRTITTGCVYLDEPEQARKLREWVERNR